MAKSTRYLATKKKSHAVVMHSPAGVSIYATNCMPLLADIRFPHTFTSDDQRRAWESLRVIYQEVINRD